MARRDSEPRPGPAVREPLDERALRILADVTGYLAAGLGSEEVLTRVVGALARGLGTDECRVWVRTPDGSGFRAIVAEGVRVPGSRSIAEVTGWFDGTELEQQEGETLQLRFPLSHEGERLGVLEAVIADGPGAGTLRDVVGIVANILSPFIASVELSEDLASEVALRTREIDAQRRFTSKIIDSLPVGLYVIDRDYRIQAWNRKRETGTQGMVREEVLGKTVFEVLRRQPRVLLKREFDRAFSTGRMEQLESESTATGEVRSYRLTKVPMRLDDDEVTHVITIAEDITEWKHVQQQVSQTEKLAAVGQLAAGVMHEINNPLATIGACVEALSLRIDDLPPGERQGYDEYLRIMESELGRCHSIVDGLLDFSRPKARVKRPAQVNQIVEDALFLVKHHDKFKGIRLEQHLSEGLPGVQANAEQLIQVFLSLMLNAIDAMEGKGVLSVRTAFNPERVDEVVVEFSDTGMGIAREDLPKIFEPFFSTKLPGQGTGLGLSICYGIVQEHGGRLIVDSQLGHGSVFRVILPIGGIAGEP
ncbi:MAG: PAS domain-containing protein [Gemmatimonadales bacterium]|nr:PAS domain-containing protein [Gemmatimonadales bacterium]NIN10977.1 PAS domain-containing protein [Gemmatimonadales bacterium]NIN49569.1 PAS domain-containing protein [Gemmatimonadales bacterium]NIP07033.1 PAS domain-containing protein [Gemmatimonadales bacterium]NIR01667.1 PAS domain-containing protein [Gemmatimonadales bacterium]